MMISFEVDARDMIGIGLAFVQFGGKTDQLADVLLAAKKEVHELKSALRDIVEAVDADPATYKGTTLAMIRDIAGKALGEPTEA